MRKLSIVLLILYSCGDNSAPKKSETNTDKDVNTIQHNAVFQTQVADDLNEKGLKLAYAGQYDEARQEFLAALDYEDKNPTLLNNLGLVEKAENNREEAADYFQQAIAADSTYYNAYTNYGLLLYEMKDYKTSLKFLDQVFQNCDNQMVLASAHLHAAFCYSAMKECKKARQHFDESRQFTKNDPSFDKQSAEFEEELKTCE